MYNMVMFDTVEELLTLTGETDESKLWNVGFCLDDWDVGFQTEKPMHHVYMVPEEDRDDFFDDGERDVPNNDAHWLMVQLDNYCVGYSYVEYKGKHYYLAHHA